MEDGKQMINILYEDNHLLVVEKPINMGVCLDDSLDNNLLDELKKYLKEKYQKPGNVYLGLVHRLDRPVGGVMVFAKTSKASSRLSEQVRTRRFEKKYYAVVCGNLKGNGKLVDKLEKDHKKNISFVSEKGKECSLDYNVIETKENLTLVDINLNTGRSHQIRVQFSSRNYPLYGDQKYNKKAIVSEQIALFAYSLSFYHPITLEKLTFSLNLPDRYPFSLFK